MPSKYDALFPKLQPLPVQDAPYQERVEKEKEQITNKTPTALARSYEMLRAMKEDVEEQLSTINLSLEAHAQLLAHSQEVGEEGWGQYGASDTMLRLVSGAKVEVRKEPYASVVDHDANRAWAIKQGLERKLTLPWSTVNSLTKEMLLKGMPEPDGVKCYFKTNVVFTKVKQDVVDPVTRAAAAEQEVL